MNLPAENTAFARRLYGDHIEEIEFLLAQRIGLFHDPEIMWPDIAEFEERLMAHVDGMVLGGEAADEIAIGLLDDDDIDIVRGSAFTLAYSEQTSALEAVIDRMIHASDETLPAYVDALKHPPSNLIATLLSHLLEHDRPEVRAAAVEILGYRREGDPEHIAAMLDDSDNHVARQAAIAIRRLRYEKATDRLVAILDSADTSVAIEAGFALMTFQSPAGIDWLRATCSAAHQDSGKAAIYLALAGNLRDAESIVGTDSGMTSDGLGALGIIGNPSSFDNLIQAMNSDDDSIRLAAAEAIYLITGAGLIEEYTHVEEWIGPDESEIETDETTLTRVSTSPDAWSAWLSENGENFTRGQRWRNGKPFAESLLVYEIADPRSRCDRRQHAYLELLVRGTCDEPFEADWFISSQNIAIARIRDIHG